MAIDPLDVVAVGRGIKPSDDEDDDELLTDVEEEDEEDETLYTRLYTTDALFWCIQDGFIEALQELADKKTNNILLTISEWEEDDG